MAAEPPDVTVADAMRMADTLVVLHDRLAEFWASCGSAPSPGSQAARELDPGPYVESVESAYAQADLLLESAADHAMALTRTVTGHVQTLAPWTCIRAGLEAGALACWLSDPSIDARRRAGRSLALQYEGLEQQRKYSMAKGNTVAAARASRRVDDLEAIATQLGFKPLRDDRDKRTGVAQVLPSITSLTGQQLGEETTYRLLSAVAHGHFWAASQLGFRRADSSGAPFLEKHLTPTGVAYLCVKAAVAMTKPIWFKSRLFGWDVAAFSVILDSTYGRFPRHVGVVRFWSGEGGGSPAN